jgi:hypothetical protein
MYPRKAFATMEFVLHEVFRAKANMPLSDSGQNSSCSLQITHWAREVVIDSSDEYRLFRGTAGGGGDSDIPHLPAPVRTFTAG